MSRGVEISTGRRKKEISAEREGLPGVEGTKDEDRSGEEGLTIREGRFSTSWDGRAGDGE